MSRYDDIKVKEMIELSKNFCFREALQQLEWYMDLYPDDLRTIIIYAGLLVKIGRTGDAEKVINYLEEKRLNDLDKTRRNSIDYLKMKLLLVEERYMEALELINTCGYVDKLRDANLIELICLKALNRPIKKDENNKGYLYNQIINYDPKKALDHITIHKDSNQDKSYFSKEVDIESLFNKCQQTLSESPNVIYVDNVDYLRIYRYDKCGYSKGKLVDYFAVVTISNTDHILSMYPIDNPERIRCLDITPILESKKQPVRVSQIDKFNARYGKSK